MEQNKKTLVFGAGLSGASASALLLKNKKSVILYDGNKDLDLNAAKERVAAFGVSTEGLSVVAGTFPDPAEIEMAVLSPGIPIDLPEVEQMKAAGIPVIGEVELAFRYGNGRVYAITGTNGKTTTTVLTGELMKAAHAHVDVVGNIGNPYAAIAADQTEETITVAEISSFQLETVSEFHPKAAVITNITEDHMNRHYTMENYVNCKKRVAAQQTEEDCLILNYEDEILRAFADEVRSQVVFFSSERKLEKGLYLDNGAIVVNDGTGEKEIIRIEELQIVGKHNYENVMCAAAVALYDGMEIEKIREVLKSFKGVEHRIEFVGEFGGVKYYNDSKGTNPAAAIKGIQAMSGPTFLIAGGYDKHSNYDEWIGCFDGKVKKLVLIGQTKQIIADAALALGFPKEDIVFCEDLKEAVAFCAGKAVSGDTVLLSPACASWGQFDNYEQRGDFFKEYVKETAK